MQINLCILFIYFNFYMNYYDYLFYSEFIAIQELEPCWPAFSELLGDEYFDMDVSFSEIDTTENTDVSFLSI